MRIQNPGSAVLGEFVVMIGTIIAAPTGHKWQTFFICVLIVSRVGTAELPKENREQNIR